MASLVRFWSSLDIRSEGLRLLRKASDSRAPRRVIRLNQIAIGLYFCREYDGAVNMAKQVIRENPEYPPGNRWLAAALGQGVPWIRPQDHAHMVQGVHKAGWRP
jgi:hypothetical protein